MSSIPEAEAHERGTGLVATLGRMGESLVSLAESPAMRLRAAWRHEVRRAAAALAFAIVTAFFVCTAAGVAFFLLMLAFWDTHRVLAAALGAVILAVMAVVSALLLQGCTQSNRP